MQAPKFRQLQADLSVLRLGALARSDHDPAHPRDVFAWHLFNAAIGEALYPALQLLELAMRNRIDAALREWAGDAAWHRCELPLTPGQASRLIITLNELSDQHLALRQLIAGISPELDQLARAMDRFEPVIRGGVEPWRQRVPA